MTIEEGAQYERAVLAGYRAAFLRTGLSYEALAATTGISRAKLVRLVGPNPDGTAALEPSDSYRLARALGVNLVDIIRDAEESIGDESAWSDAESD